VLRFPKRNDQIVHTGDTSDNRNREQHQGEGEDHGSGLRLIEYGDAGQGVWVIEPMIAGFLDREITATRSDLPAMVEPDRTKMVAPWINA
jgi:hypothetical protein